MDRGRNRAGGSAQKSTGSAGFQPATRGRSPLRKTRCVHAWASPTSRLEAGAPSAGLPPCRPVTAHRAPGLGRCAGARSVSAAQPLGTGGARSNPAVPCSVPENRPGQGPLPRHPAYGRGLRQLGRTRRAHIGRPVVEWPYAAPLGALKFRVEGWPRSWGSQTHPRLSHAALRAKISPPAEGLKSR